MLDHEALLSCILAFLFIFLTFLGFLGISFFCSRVFGVSCFFGEGGEGCWGISVFRGFGDLGFWGFGGLGFGVLGV